MTFAKPALLAGVSLLLLTAACSPKTAQTTTTQTTATAAPAAPNTADGSTVLATQTAPNLDVTPVEDPVIVASVSDLAPPINKAEWSAEAVTPQAKKNALLRAEVLLARAHFSPGVIDGQDGGNLQNAIAAFEAANNLPVDGKMDQAVWEALSKDKQPALTDYEITAADVKGPFPAKIPTDMTELSKLDYVGFTSPAEELAERFHMDEALLKSLNPGVDFSVPGTKIVVAALGSDRLKGQVTKIEVDKTKRQVRAYGGDVLLAVYPATVGSTDRPAPSCVSLPTTPPPGAPISTGAGQLSQNGGPDSGSAPALDQKNG